MVEIIPTIVPDSLADVVRESERYSGFANFFQIDVADGVFAPNTTWMPSKGERLPSGFSYEIHLMVAEPHEAGLLFAKAGAHTLIVHMEALRDAEKARQNVEEWKKTGVQSVGIGVLFQTPLADIAPYLPCADFVLLMTIARIGVQGIPFEQESISRVAEFRRMYPDVPIAVDGGVSEKNIADLVRAGATHFGVGLAIAKSSDPKEAYEHLKKTAENALQ